MKRSVVMAAAVILSLTLAVGVLLLCTVGKSGNPAAVSPSDRGDEALWQLTEEAEALDCFTYYERDGAIVFSGCTENLSEIIVPAEIDGLPVKYISDNAFYGGMHWNLERVVLPRSVESIGSWAFEDCESLREINIGNVSEIGERAFFGCSALEKMNIGKNTVSIGERAFGGAGAMLTLDPANTSFRFDGGCLYSADGKTLLRVNCDVTEYTPPASVTVFAPGALEFSSVKSVTIPDSVKEIGAYAFYDCHGLTEMTIPASIRRIEEYTFTYCQNLVSVSLPEKLEYIGREAFCDDFRMKSMEIPASVREIRACAVGYNYYDGDSVMRSNDFTLYCTAGSAAEQYAEENNIAFRLL